jgi:hypothetical protein
VLRRTVSVIEPHHCEERSLSDIVHSEIGGSLDKARLRTFTKLRSHYKGHSSKQDVLDAPQNFPLGITLR